MKLRKGLWGGALLICVALVAAVVLAHRPANAGGSLELTVVTLSPSSTHLEWTRLTGSGTMVRYRIQRNGNVFAVTTKTTFDDRGLTPGRTYRYRILAGENREDRVLSAPGQATTPKKATTASYPQRISANRRYLVDQHNRPYLLVGDSPQALTVNVSVAETDRYMADRRAAGFNAAWVNLLCNAGTGGRDDGTTYDDIPPFTTPEDLSTPNEAYFTRVDTMVRLAQKHGITMFLDPIETIGWMGALHRNGLAKAYEYGRFLGRRYRMLPNIVWFNGNDFASWRDRSDTALVKAVARGIRSEDPNHLQTVELWETKRIVASSLNDPTWRPLIELNAVYTYYPTYAELLRQYNLADHLPTFMVEANYEFEHNHYRVKGAETLRRQEYWTMLSGATGQLYGNRFTWQFLDGWQNHLDTTGSAQLRYVTKLFAPRAWYRLVPDQDHAVVTGGYGTFSSRGAVDESDYVTAARTPDGKLLIAYMPSGGAVTVDMTKLVKRVRASWYDPTTGTFTAASGSRSSPTGGLEFRPPGRNRDGDDDWLLVLSAS